jgi:quercetin dioxygenase-like cupin family protein
MTMIRCVRIWTDAGGNSDFEEGAIELSGRHGADTLSPVAAATSISFRETPPDGDSGWHDAPAMQLVITLSGTLRFTVKDGRSFTIRPGEVLFAQDTIGTGHTWKLRDEEPWRRAYVVVEDPAAVPFIARAML